MPKRPPNQQFCDDLDELLRLAFAKKHASITAVMCNTPRDRVIAEEAEEKFEEAKEKFIEDWGNADY